MILTIIIIDKNVILIILFYIIYIILLKILFVILGKRSALIQMHYCKVTAGRNIKAHLFTRVDNSPWLIKIPQRDFFFSEKSSTSSRFLFLGVLSEYSGSLRGTSGMFASALCPLYTERLWLSTLFDWLLGLLLIQISVESCWLTYEY